MVSEFFTYGLQRTPHCPVCFGDVMAANQSQSSVISQGPTSLTNEVSASTCSAGVFMVPAPRYVIKCAEAVIITSEMTRN
jgi:hypothetical protein